MLFTKSIVGVLALTSSALAGRCKPSSPSSVTSSAAASSSSTRAERACDFDIKLYPDRSQIDHCGVRGVGTGVNLISFTGVPNTLQEWAMACYEQGGTCEGFFFAAGVCQKFDPFHGGFVPDSQNGNIDYWEMKCFSCRLPASTTFAP